MGPTHTTHEEIREHGLADGCPRCEEHAQDPFRSLDDGNLNELLIRAENDERPRSQNEGIAMNKVRDALQHEKRLARLRQLA